MLSLPSPSFADDITLLAIYPIFLSTFMNLCYEYSIRWRYEFHNDKSDIVTFGETKRIHCQSIKQRNWVVGNEIVDERYEYKNLGVVKNYVGSFSSNVEDNIDKTRKKAGMIFASGFDRRKVNPFVYIKVWRQACLPSLLYGVELFTVTPTLTEKFERCQIWFLKNLFFVPKFTPKHLLLKLSELNFVESEIALRKFLFLGCLITETKMAPVERKLFDTMAKSFFDTSIDSLGVLPSICDALKKYGLFCYFDYWFIDSSFPTYFTRKTIRRYRRIREFEANEWDTFITDHSDLYIVHDCPVNTPPRKLWSISEQFPDLVCCLHTHVRLMGSLGLYGGIPWLRNTEGTLCFICKHENETLNHFPFVCTSFRRHFNSLWANLVSKINNSNPTDGAPMSHFIMNLNQHHKTLLLLGCLPLPFDISTMTVITRFIAAAIGKIY